MAALELIQQLAPHQLARMERDCPRIVIGAAGAAAAMFKPDSRLVVLDFDTIRDHGDEPVTLALILVHEATHARLTKCGIDYQSQRDRIERLCRRAERSFADRLPEKDRAHYRVYYDSQEVDPPDYSREAEIARTVAALRELGFRDWMIRPLEAYARRRLRR